MKSAIAIVALVGVAQGLVGRGSTCCFELTASGGASGLVGQLSDGQNRVGGSGLPTGTYCISSSGGITDGQGRGCILTPPTTQFQCDTGAAPTTGFSVACDGTLSYDGSSTFYACQTGDNGENIYTSVNGDETGCTEITLTADNCKSCPAAKTCPTSLSGTYEFPHLIIPVNSASPNTAYGTSYFGEVSPTESSIFNFDIPEADSGKTCSLVFLFPTQAELETSSFTISGDGEVDFASLKSAATSATDYANQPAVATDYGNFKLSPGNSYLISTFSCPAGETVAYKLSSSTTTFNYFQDYNPSPIGLYITVC